MAWADVPADLLGRVLALLPPTDRRAARATCGSWRQAFDERAAAPARPLLPLAVAAAANANDSPLWRNLGRVLLDEACTTTTAALPPPSFPAARALLVPAVRAVGSNGASPPLAPHVTAAAPFPPAAASTANLLPAALARLYPRAERADLSGWRGPGAIDAALALTRLEALDLGGADLPFHRAASLSSSSSSSTITTTTTTLVAPLSALALKTNLRRLSLAGSRVEAQVRRQNSTAAPASPTTATTTTTTTAAAATEATLALLALRGLPRLRALDLGRLPPDRRAGWPLHARGLLEGADGCSAGGGWTGDDGGSSALPFPSLRDRAVAGAPPFAPRALKKKQTLCVRHCCALLPQGLTRLDLLLQPLTLHDVRDVRGRLSCTLRSLSLSWAADERPLQQQQQQGGAGAAAEDPALARALVLASRAAARAYDAALGAEADEGGPEAAALLRGRQRQRSGDDHSSRRQRAHTAASDAAWQARAAQVAALDRGEELEGEGIEDEAAFDEDEGVLEQEDGDDDGRGTTTTTTTTNKPPPPPPLARLLTHLGSLPHLRRLELHLPSADVDLGGWPPAPITGLTRLRATLEDLTLGCCPSSDVLLSLAALTGLTALRLVGGEDAELRGRRRQAQQQQQQQLGDGGPFGSPDDWMGGSVAVTAQAVAHVARSLPRLGLLRVTMRVVGSGIAPPGDELLSQLLFAGAGGGGGDGGPGLRVLQLPCVPLHGTGLWPPDEVAGLGEDDDEMGLLSSSSSSSSDEEEDDADADAALDGDGRGRGCCWSDDGAGDESSSGSEREEDEEEDDRAAKARPPSRPLPPPPTATTTTGPAPWARAGAVPLPTDGDGGGGDDNPQQQHQRAAHHPSTHSPPHIERLELDASVLMHGAVRSMRRLRGSLVSLTLWRSDSDAFAAACRRGCYATGVGALSRLTSLRVVAPVKWGREGGGGGVAAAAGAAAAQQQQQQGPVPMDQDGGGFFSELTDASDVEDDEDEDEDEEDDDGEPIFDPVEQAADIMGGMLAAAAAVAGVQLPNPAANPAAANAGPPPPPPPAAARPPPTPACYFEPHLQFLSSLTKLRELQLTSLNTLLSSALRPLSALPRLRRCALGGALALDQESLAAASTAARWPRLRALTLSGVAVVVPPFDRRRGKEGGRLGNAASASASASASARRRLAAPTIDDLLVALLDACGPTNKPQLEAVDLRWHTADRAVAEALERAQASAVAAVAGTTGGRAEDEDEDEDDDDDPSHAMALRTYLTEDGLREAARRAPRSLRYLRLVGVSLLARRERARRALAEAPSLVWAECLDADPGGFLAFPLLPPQTNPSTYCLPDEARASDGAPRSRNEWRFVRLPAAPGEGAAVGARGPLVDSPFFGGDEEDAGRDGGGAVE